MKPTNQIPDVHEDPVDRKAVFFEKLQAAAIVAAVLVITARALGWF